MFVVHRESESKPNMEFRMHESGLHYYDSRKEVHLTFVNTVSDNKEGFTQKADQGIGSHKKLVQDFELPLHEGFQVGDSKQPNQGLSRDSPRYRCGSKDLGQEHRSAKRQDHLEQVDSGG
jgi:hypothetical protein